MSTMLLQYLITYKAIDRRGIGLDRIIKKWINDYFQFIFGFNISKNRVILKIFAKFFGLVGLNVLMIILISSLAFIIKIKQTYIALQSSLMDFAKYSSFSTREPIDAKKRRVFIFMNDKF
jgi:hypothetical protein